MWALPFAAHAAEVDLGKGVHTVVLESVDSAITVREDAGATAARLVATERVEHRMCALVVTEKKGTATVTFGPKSAAQPEKCAMDFEVVLAHGDGGARVHTRTGAVTVRGTSRPVEVDTDDGDIVISGTRGPVKAVADRGDVHLADAAGALDLLVAAGNLRGTAPGGVTADVRGGVIELSALAAPVAVSTAGGRIVLVYATAPASGEISAKATGGHVAIDLPPGTTVRCLVTATGGSVTCELPHADDAPLTVHAIADGGAVRVF